MPEASGIVRIEPANLFVYHRRNNPELPVYAASVRQFLLMINPSVLIRYTHYGSQVHRSREEFFFTLTNYNTRPSDPKPTCGFTVPTITRAIRNSNNLFCLLRARCYI
jgi:hypothetical protein